METFHKIIGSDAETILWWQMICRGVLIFLYTLVLLHWLLATLSQHSKRLGHFIKGTEVLIVKDGKIQREALRKTNMTEHDLMESLRSSGSTTDIESVRAAYLERSGSVSVIKR